jgi:hypothetical protein
MDINTLVQIFGGAGVSFYVMWLWLKTIKDEKKDLVERLELEQENRIKELKEILPLLTDSSKVLQEILKSSERKNDEIIETIINHIDKKIDELKPKK